MFFVSAVHIAELFGDIDADRSGRKVSRSSQVTSYVHTYIHMYT